MGTTKNLAEVIRRKLTQDPDLAAGVEAERFNLNVGAAIYEARTQAGLTQRQLAERTGMRQPAVARLEDADYDGHSLKTLERIAFALGKRIEITFADQSVAPQSTFIEELDIDVSEWREESPPWEPEVTTTREVLDVAKPSR